MRKSLKKYRVLVYGRNFRLMWGEGKRKKARITGFLTWRYVEAKNIPDAETRAFALLEREERLVRSVVNRDSDPPLVRVEEIEEVPRFPAGKKAEGSFIFFHGKGAGRPRSPGRKKPRAHR